MSELPAAPQSARFLQPWGAPVGFLSRALHAVGHLTSDKDPQGFIASETPCVGVAWVKTWV